MPDGLYPQEALDAAASEVARQSHGGAADPEDIRLASDILGASAPHIQAAERERIRQLAGEYDPIVEDDDGNLIPFADLIDTEGESNA